MPPTIKQIVAKLSLTPHGNGGHFKETHRDKETIPHEALNFYTSKEDKDPRSMSTCITVLLPGGKNNFSALHKVESDEVYHFYFGTAKLNIIILDTIKKEVNKIVMSSDIINGDFCQYVFEKGVIWGSYCDSDDENDYCCFGASVSPGFDYRDFKVISRKEALELFPEAKSDIERVTLPEHK